MSSNQAEENNEAGLGPPIIPEGNNNNRAGSKKRNNLGYFGKKRSLPFPHVKFPAKTGTTLPSSLRHSRKVAGVLATEDKLRPSQILARTTMTLPLPEATTLSSSLSGSHSNSRKIVRRPVQQAQLLPKGGIPEVIEFFDMESHTCQLKSAVDVSQPIFQPYPQKVTFADYKPYSIYEQTLYFRNNDLVPRRMRVFLPASPYFEISNMRALGKGIPLKDSKVAGGMEVYYTIRFKPQEVKDYSCELTVCTEREKFVVPVVALGKRPLLQAPDDVHFDVIPVKSTGTKQITMRNMGSCATDFQLSCSHSAFSVTPEKGMLPAQSTCPIQVSFNPHQIQEAYEGDLVVQCTGGDTMHIGLHGAAKNVDIALSEDLVTLDKTHISLSSQRSIKIFNRSEIPVRFSWKGYGDAQQEGRERGRLRSELLQMKQEEECSIQWDIRERGSQDSWDGTIASTLAGTEGMDTDDGATTMPLDVRAAHATVARKYKQLLRALNEDKMLYEDEIFEVFPLQGEVWPGGEAIITITFRPNVSIDYQSEAYLDVVGLEHRLPLTFKGHGIGPKARLSYDVLDVGDIYVGSTHKYEMAITNKGNIKCEWQVVEPEIPLGLNYVFSPSAGVLDVGESTVITADFISGVLGDFNDRFAFCLKGSDQPIIFQVKGHILGPSFTFDVNSLDYGPVAFDFINSKIFRITNTCEIAMNYTLRVPQDAGFTKREFQITPKSGIIGPFEQQEVTVNFVPETVKAYDGYYLTMDIDKVGQGIGNLPIHAICEVPNVKLASSDLEYGEIFLRYPYDKEVVLINTHPDLTAKYEILPQDENSSDIATFEGLPSIGAIPPNCEHKVMIRLVSDKLGSFRLPLQVSIRGSVEPPLHVNMCATSRGPKLELQHKELKWGPTPCLQDSQRKLKLTNRSTIPAAFKAYLKTSHSCFRIDIRDGVLGPGEAVDLTLTANLDDPILHKDQLHILVAEGDNVVVPLIAKGVGTTIFCSEGLESIDFGPQLTNRVCERRLTLENRGRRKQRIKWINETINEAIVAAKADEEAKKKEQPNNKNIVSRVAELVPHYTVVPDNVELRPWTAITCVFRGQSAKIGTIAETLVCESLLGGEQHFKPIIRSNVKAKFITPLLELSESCLTYDYTWQKDVAILPQSKSLTLTNRSQLPLTFVLKAQIPFSLDSWEHSLKPGESVEVIVTFDPGYKADRRSHRVENKVVVIYSNHPQKDEIQLIGDIHFPNLDFAYTQVNFGCVLNDTTKTMLVRVKNPSTVEAAFHWSFIEDEEAKHATVKKPYIPINQVFDLLPIRSRLPPGESEDIEIVYYGHANRKFKGAVLCEVEGGPDYELSLIGEGSGVSFQLDKSFLDFGRVIHTKTEGKEFVIMNPSKVTFAFKVSLAKVVRPGVIDVSPSSGKVFGGDRQKIIVRFSPGVPDIMCEKLLIEVAHFDPIEFSVYGEGICAGVCVSLPREKSCNPYHWRSGGEEQADDGSLNEQQQQQRRWEDLLEEAQKRLTQVDLSLVPSGVLDNSPPAVSGGFPTHRSGRLTPSRTTARTNGGADSFRTSRSIHHMPSITSSRSGSPEPPGSGRSFGSGISGLGSMGSLGGASGRLGQHHHSPATLRRGMSLISSTDRSPSRGGGAGRSKVITAMDIEMEANRLIYIQYLEDVKKTLAFMNTGLGPSTSDNKPSLVGVPKLELLTSRTTIGAAAAPGPVNPTMALTTIASLNMTTAAGSKTLSSTKKANNGPPPFIVARHVLDFGNVIFGNVKTLTFKITNPSTSSSLSWSFPKAILANSGFTITPEKVSRLPEGASMEFEVKLNTKAVALGHKEIELPIEVKEGPATVIILRANICVPELQINQDVLDFGDLYTGCGKTMVFQLTNISPINAEWEVRKPSTVAKVDDRFTFSPHNGVLAPDQRVSVLVDYTPVDGRRSVLKLAVRVHSAPGQKTVTLVGQGRQTSIRFEPPALQFAPILPQAEAQKEVTIINDSDRSVEVYSLDFDKQWLEEENILKAVSIFGADGVTRIPIRQPGQSLPPAILEEYHRVLQSGGAAANGGGVAEAEDDGLIAPSLLGAQDLTIRNEGKAQDILVIGPPFVGSSTIIKGLRVKFPYPVIDMDEVIDYVAKLRSPLGTETRRALGRPSKAEALNAEVHSVRLQEQLVNAKATREAALKASKPAKGKAKAASEPTAEQAEVQRLEKELQATTTGGGITADLVKRILEWRLKESDAGRGSLIDNLTSSYVGAEIIAESLAQVTSNLVIFNLQMTKSDYVAHLQRVDQDVNAIIQAYELQQTDLIDGSSAVIPDCRPISQESQSKALVASRRTSFANNVPGGSRVTSSSPPGTAQSNGTRASPPPLVSGASFEKARQLSIKVAEYFDDRASGTLSSQATAFFAAVPSLLGKLNAHGSSKEEMERPQSEDQPASSTELINIALNALQSEAEVLNTVLSVIPSPLVPLPGPHELAIPQARMYQLLTRPTARAGFRHPSSKGSQKGFRIVPRDEDGTKACRWVLDPKSSTAVTISFHSTDLGSSETSLRFEAMGVTSSYTLPCVATAAVPTINTDPRNVFMRRVKARKPDGSPLSKRYILSQGVYDFGPLLVWKDAGAAKESRHSEAWKSTFASNGDTFRITNNGHFPVEATFELEKASSGGTSIFSVEPSALSLAEGETRELIVWAFPTETQAYEDILIINVKNNPSPYRFPLNASGVVPSLALKGLWTEKAAAQRALADSLPDDPRPSSNEQKGKKGPAAAGGKKGSTSAAAPPQPGPKAQALAKLLELEQCPVVDFEKLLLKKIESQEFVITNTSQVPVTWRLNTSGLAEDFQVAPSQGLLPVYGSATIAVTFTSTREAILAGEMTLEYADVSAGLDAQVNRSTYVKIKVAGEGYQVHFVPFSRTSIDFGNQRIGKSKSEALTLSNEGKYPYVYNFEFRKAWAKECLSIDAPSGTIPPGASTDVHLVFCSTRAMSIKDSKALQCKISVPDTMETVEEVNLTVSVRSVYSCARIQPSRGLNFGALKYNDPVQTKTFDIRNEGLFCFTYVITGEEVSAAEVQAALLSAATPPSSSLPPQGKAVASANKGSAAPTGSKTIGHFIISSVGGVLEPGQTASIDVSFTPTGQEFACKDFIKVHVSGADVEESATPFELAVETFLPLITCDDWRSIFEEQQVITTIEDYVGGAAATTQAVSATDIKGRVLAGSFFCQEDKSLNFGATICGSHTKGVVERIKITNPSKINSVVSFEVSYTPGLLASSANDAKPAAAGAGKGGKKGSKEAASAAAAGASSATTSKESVFSVKPTSWDIPPHEHRYVNIYFNPKEITAYRSYFVAKVQDGGGPSNGLLSFALTGAGTLPCLTIISPKERNAQGALVADLGNVQVNKSATTPIRLSNAGVVPVTVLIEAPDLSADLTITHANGSVTISPGETTDLTITYRPMVAGPLTKTFKLRVMHNAYDCTTIQVNGTAFDRDVVLEGLGDDSSHGGPDKISFPELNLDNPGEVEAGSQVVFTMVNRSKNAIKFKWPTAPHSSISLVPCRGHIPAGGQKDIMARFNATNPEQIKDLRLAMTTQSIRYTNQEATEGDKLVDWDDSQIITRPGTTEEIEKIKNPPAAAPIKTPAGKGKKDTTPVEPEPVTMWLGSASPNAVQMIIAVSPEPTNEALGPPQESPILLTAVADRPRYECNTQALSFKPTAMYQARVATFTVQNVSNVHLPYHINIQENRPVNLPVPVGEPIPNPYSVDPAEGKIPPKSSQTFTVRFLPLEVDVFYYSMHVAMPSLSSTAESCKLDLVGNSFRPNCHFDIGDEGSADYLARRSTSVLRNENGQLGPIEASSLRVVQLESLGIHTQNVKRFLVINPTSESYDFVWDHRGLPSPAWRSLTSKGTIPAGKGGEMIFEYAPEETVPQAHESFYAFRIVNQRDEALFLFCGTVVEPKIVLDRVHVDLKPTIVGTAATETFHLINHEDTHFSFSFDKRLLAQVTSASASKKGTGNKSTHPQQHPLLDISPLTGHIPPHGRTAITVTLHPDEEKKYNLNLLCSIRHKPSKLNLNLKGEGYLIHSRLLISETSASEGEERSQQLLASTVQLGAAGAVSVVGAARSKELVQRPASNVVSFGNVHMNEKAARLLTISNTGQYTYDYQVEKIFKTKMLSLTGFKTSGTLKKNEQAIFRMEFRPLKEINLEGDLVKVTIAGKYEYEARVEGVGVRPAVAFSTRKHDFGPCFISIPGLPPVAERAVLTLTNQDPSTSFSIETGFQKIRILDVLLSSTVLEAGASIDVEMVFTPREVQDYDITVPFLINGTTVVDVRVLGHGIEPRLELADTSKSLLTFGQINKGQTLVKQVQLYNASRRAIVYQLVDSQGKDLSRLDERGITITPSASMYVGARESSSIAITFAPNKRVMSFTEDLQVQFLGQTKKLLSISGQCIGYEVALETDALNFGTVCLESKRTKPLRISNSGEIALRFEWNESTFGPNISITPLDGVLQPFSELAFEVIFAPKQIDADIRITGIRLISTDAGIEHLSLTCLGACVPLPTNNVTVTSFDGRARKAEVKAVKISNPTEKPWYLNPVLMGQHWKVSEQVIVPAKGATEVHITYCPQVMTQSSATAKDENFQRPTLLTGSIFFALPNGDALLYKLEGKAGEPLPLTSTTKTPAKKATLINLPLENWLGISQKFSITITSSVANPAVSFIGVQTMELPAYATKDYILRFYSYVEGSFQARVTFLNPDNGEFVVFNVQAQVTEPGMADTIKMEVPARQTTRRLITVDNPLPKDETITFPEKWWTCDNPNIRLTPVGRMAGNSEGVFEVQYRPLVPTAETGEPQEAMLSFRCQELGTFKYALKLKATATASQPTLSFEAPLGSSQAETFIFRAYNTAPLKFELKADKPTFFTFPPVVEVPAGGWEGQDVKVPVTFEPESISTVTNTLTIVGGLNGEYQFILRGTARPPIPQGPLRFNAGESKELPFRNVLQEATEFTLSVDNPQFVLSKASELIGPKASKGISITYKDVAVDGKKAAAGSAASSASSPSTGKLTVTAKNKPNLVSWAYYLRGP